MTWILLVGCVCVAAAFSTCVIPEQRGASRLRALVFLCSLFPLIQVTFFMRALAPLVNVNVATAVFAGCGLGLLASGVKHQLSEWRYSNLASESAQRSHA